MSPIVRLENVTKRFANNVLAVDNVSLDVRKGEFITLLGESGCGKTTTLRMIGGFEVPTSGRVYLGDRDITALPPYRRRVNTVFQDYALFPHMTVEANVGYGLKIARASKAEIAATVAETLSMIGLEDKSKQLPHQLSGGQKQRVALARALVRKPEVLLLDEPLSALDAKLRAAMRVELKHLHEHLGLTFIFVTHDQTEALVMSDRIIVMHQGRLIQDGTPTALYDRPESPYVASFIGASNMLSARVVSVARGEIVVRLRGGEVRCRANGRAFSEGSRAIICVRPSKVEILEDGAPLPADFSVVQGVVRDCLFHGESYRVQVDIKETEPFIVDVKLPNDVNHAVLPVPGSNIAVSVNPAVVTAFLAEEAW